MNFFGGPRGGNNPRYGRDTGAPPPDLQTRGGTPCNVPQQNPPPGGYFGQSQSVFNMAFAGMGPFAPGYPPGATQPMIWPSGGTAPSQPPVLDSSFPAVNMTNSTGGVGCEPGYNYFFPSEHTKVHVLKTGDTPPWNLRPQSVLKHYAAHIPVNTTLGALLKGFGACNPDPSKNRIFEVHEGANGKWYKGMCFTGDDAGAMDKTIKSIGWDATRTGLPGGKPVVFVYVTKD
ncbi:hypothetical protein N0V93_008467 [Gnomoniopsis smithogilvyi]|uniref:Uncharacterized protein n=1 Tax=Gnomoniopsis smithogilvyi TaxID=1191159 RepID=A0A9W8YLR8_9PEZI|nr:hypothetical protein N0V93_008467 [Gnomoniopsis smithogilvyi]